MLLFKVTIYPNIFPEVSLAVAAFFVVVPIMIVMLCVLVFFLLDLDKLYAAANTEKAYSVIAKYPAVTRDIALLVDDEVLVADMEDAIKKAGQPLVESIKLFDVYKGEQIPAGKKSVAYAIVYRDPKKTLEDKVVNKVHDKILRALEHKLSAELR